MASILPTNNSNNFGGYHNNESNRFRRNSNSLLHRVFRFPQMDFEFALWQMLYLLIAPGRVYRSFYYHKQTKNQWSRDDPAFIMLIIAFLSLSGIIWSTTYHLGLLGTIRLLFSIIFFQFLLLGSIIATCTWYIANKFLTQDISAFAVSQKVEWAYAFDVHCNSFVPIFVILHIVQLFFMPLLLKDNWISLFIGNGMYCSAVIWYIVITFSGFSALPFLVHTELFLYPIALCTALFIASLFGFNISQYVIAYYFK